jgi:hypothetical protein
MLHASAATAAAAAACMRACVAAFVIDTIYELTRRRRPGRGESNFRIEKFEKNGYGQKGELGAVCPELALLFVSILLEYFHTKIRFALRSRLGRLWRRLRLERGAGREGRPAQCACWGRPEKLAAQHNHGTCM